MALINKSEETMKKIFVTWDDVQRQTTEILRRMQLENWKPDYIVGITRGGLTLSNLLSQYLDVTMYTLDVRLRDGKNVPCETNAKLAEIAFGMNNGSSTGARWDVGQRKKVLIVDDINDSGATINWIKADWENTIKNKINDDIDYVWDSIWNKTTKFAVLYDNIASEAKLDVNFAAEEINKVDDPSWIVFPWEEWWKRWDPNEEVIK
jgi:hypoxanthine phosphoribosyltransferase